jgi:hypothetical protein
LSIIVSFSWIDLQKLKFLITFQSQLCKFLAKLYDPIYQHSAAFIWKWHWLTLTCWQSVVPLVSFTSRFSWIFTIFQAVLWLVDLVTAFYHFMFHSFHWHVQNATIPCCCQELLPFLSVLSVYDAHIKFCSIIKSTV